MLCYIPEILIICDPCQFVAIGATTEREITSLDCHCLSVAESPTPNSLLCSIREVIASAL